ncbi:MAG: ATP-binding cassette domain-containing protein [Bacteroidales bacterium]|nr:ATP-binding cassette domain-containing protein [Bacteroidales bacterium]
MSIIVNNVSKVFGEQYALNKVSFEAKKGEIVGFLGPNGAGKTTMMKIITGLIPPTEGDVSVCGLDIWKDSLKLRQIIGYLSEANPLYYDMYVREFLEFVAGVFHIKDKKKSVDQVIELTGLTPEQHKKIGALSRGYKQRVGIAQALIHDPEVLILDEPTTGLDPNQLIEIRELIRSYGKNRTVLLSTHIMQEVQAMCDHVIIINKGELVADTLTKDLHLLAEKVGLKTAEDLDALGMEQLFHRLTMNDAMTR